jgi:uncharacterized protein
MIQPQLKTGVSMNSIENKLEQVKNELKALDKVLVAFSGGVDSTLLLKIASEALPGKVLAVTATSPTYPAYEFEEAVKIANDLRVPHKTVESRELSNKNFVENSPERCYHCKTELFTDLQKMAREEGYNAVLDASNADDVDDYRPGMKAARELGIISPLKTAGFSKNEIRSLSKEMGLHTWDKPSFACLASRFPYGTKITARNLETVAEGEKFLKNMGFKQFRVRHHAPIVRLELDDDGMLKIQKEKIREDIIRKFKELGYLYITVDIQGYRTGSLNEGLEPMPDK